MANASFLKSWTDPWRSYVAEFLGTFFFVLISSWVVLLGSLYGNITVIESAVAIGFCYAVFVFITAHAAGGFLNPAITIALWLTRKLTDSKAIFFIIAQLLASFSAAEVIFIIFGQNAFQFHFGIPTLGLGISAQTAFVVEAVLSGGLVLAVFGTMVDRSGPVSFGPLVLGLYLVAVTIVAQPISGAVFNPARVIGPAVLSSAFPSLGTYVIGSLAGGLFGLVYELVFLQRGKKNR